MIVTSSLCSICGILMYLYACSAIWWTLIFRGDGLDMIGDRSPCIGAARWQEIPWLWQDRHGKV